MTDCSGNYLKKLSQIQYLILITVVGGKVLLNTTLTLTGE